ncbi:phosphotriesterase [Bacillus cereus]|uniref:Phosphotriesterase n=1 Tax=Bacillus thuringiensis TaxID=1428 RepID=A0AAW4I0M6_BACTU|nr:MULTISPECIES: phosphotriesterase [Bacillus cereus group]EOO05588.1 hypothetical protein IAW_05254 [Bacillus cereus str. Schrouff]EOO82087.1 hypothetical protein IGY_05347 [Bacillus cereus K-5975c]MBJ8090603.1 phosphotriesterase [Bacillus cereus]MBN9901724.1 phosphotriesterase [Bacillus thuringiensis]MCM3223893.1 phosphotriesterase [Bacillus cereus]
MIQTVTGCISPKELGICIAHEHICIDLSYLKNESDAVLDNVELLEEELKLFQSAGGQSIVEVTTTGMGRNIHALRRLSEITGIQIIASTGFYKEPFLPDFTKNWGREQFAEHFIREAEIGIEDSGILPGVIGEVGSSLNQITSTERSLLEGAAIAGARTGLPVTTHTTLGTMALEQLELFGNSDLSMEQLIIGHQDLNGDRESILRIVQEGAFVGFDTIGKEKYRSNQERIEDLLFLFEKGYSSQVLLSTDLTRKSHLRKNGGNGYAYILTEFISELIRAGFTIDDVELMLKENPSRAFMRREVESS